MPAVSGVPRTSKVRHALVWMLGIGYGGIIVFIVFWPSPIDRPVRSMLMRLLQELHERGIPAFVDYAFIELLANIALFLPVGLFFGLLLPIRYWPVAYLLGPMLSVLVELTQKLLDDRYSSFRDIVTNSIGAVIGVTLALLLRMVVAQRDRQVIAQHEALAALRQDPQPR